MITYVRLGKRSHSTITTLAHPQGLAMQAGLPHRTCTHELTTKGSCVPAEIAAGATIGAPVEQANEGRGWTAGWTAGWTLHGMHMPLTFPVTQGGGERHML